MKKLLLAPAVLAVVAALALTGCTDNTKTASASGGLTVKESDTECSVSANEAPSGPVTFTITNSGSKVNEFEVLAADGLRIVGELENIGPGVTRDVTVQLAPGDYQTACVPGMIGAGQRAAFKVTDSGTEPSVSADRKQLQKTAVSQYIGYIKDQTAQLVTGTDDFVKAFESGDEAKAKELYPTVRAHYERIEPVAESFGDLDPALDFREADLEKGQAFTGWHRAEKDLWAPKGYTKMTDAERKKIGDKMVSDTKKLYDEVFAKDYKVTIADIGNGSVGLMDEVSTGKVTGEEELFSHTDLYDFKANVEGAQVAFETLQPLLENSGDKELVDELNTRFEKVNSLLAKYKDGDGYKLYDELSKDQVKELSDAVNALANPLQDLTKTAVKAK